METMALNTRDDALRDMGAASSFTPEICASICLFVQKQKTTATRRTLVSLARTSKSFQEPALDAIWRSLPGIAPLLFTLPEDLWFVGGKQILDGVMRLPMLGFRRKPTPEDLVRLHTYAARVKEIRVRFTSKRIPLISPNAWTAMQRVLTAPLLPNLTSLTHNEACGDPGCEKFQWPAELLVGPKLQSVALAVRKTPWDSQPAARIFATLSQEAPLLTRVDISTVLVQGITNATSLGAEISGLKHLVSFHAPTIDLLPGALQHLASLPNLAFISIKTQLSDTATTAFPHTGTRVGSFPALRKARIYTNCFVWCAAFLDVISSPVLRELVIDSRYCPSKVPAFESLLSALGRLPCGDSLAHLSIFSGEDNACLLPGPAIIPAHALAPLASLTGLRFVRITGWCELLLDDATLTTLARAWPHIQHLDVHFPLSHPELIFSIPVSRPLVTLLGLASLARACPHLLVLRLPIDARVVPPLEPTAPLTAHGRTLAPKPPAVPPLDAPPKLHGLDVGESPIGDPVRVASHLSLFFPALRECFHGFGEEETAWDEFWEAYEMFVKVRESERRMRARRAGAGAVASGS
ncbi:hypothetical protein C8Q77DRAFT_1245718 [Trametes polyzona]|nr:hypothetical protein C8Q77DRAFT_1245718 [Trametes polyzona]